MDGGISRDILGTVGAYADISRAAAVVQSRLDIANEDARKRPEGCGKGLRKELRRARVMRVYGFQLTRSWRTLPHDVIARLFDILASFSLVRLKTFLSIALADGRLKGMCNGCHSDGRHLPECPACTSPAGPVILTVHLPMFAQTGRLDIPGISDAEFIRSLLDLLGLMGYVERIGPVWADDMNPDDTLAALGVTRVGPMLLLVLKFLFDKGVCLTPRDDTSDLAGSAAGPADDGAASSDSATSSDSYSYYSDEM